VEKLYTNPRRIFSLPEQKNTYIEVDLDEEWVIPAETKYCRSKWTPFTGHHVRGCVRKVVLRGQVAYIDGQVSNDLTSLSERWYYQLTRRPLSLLFLVRGRGQLNRLQKGPHASRFGWVHLAVLFVLCLFWVVFSLCFFCHFYFVFCPVFSSMNQREWHCL